MKEDAIDSTLLQETLQECDELLENAANTLIEIEMANFHFCETKYNEVFRFLHSVKGALAMVGIETPSQLIHTCESYFQECFSLKSFPVKIIEDTISRISEVQTLIISQIKPNAEKNSLDPTPIKFEISLKPPKTNFTPSILTLNMLKKLEWNEHYLTGNLAIDLAHKNIFETIKNEIIAFDKKKYKPNEQAVTLSEVIGLLKMHFEAELVSSESLNETFNSKHLLHHRIQYDRICEYQTNLIRLEVIPSLTILMGLARDLIDHLQYEVSLFRITPE